MDIHNLVVARYADGRVLKGTTRDFSALRPSLHVQAEGTDVVTEIRMRQLKALFFVKSFDGFPGRDDVRGFVDGPPETQQGRKIAVRFRDGEFLCGYTMSWSPDREGFFMFPADKGSNNDRVFVVVAATDEVKAGPAAEVLAQRVLAGQAARSGGAAPARPPVPGMAPRPPVPGMAPPSAGGTRIGPRPQKPDAAA